MIFDFIEGAVGREKCHSLNEKAFDDIKLKPRILAGVENRSLSKSVLGYEFDLPFGIAPMGGCNLAWPNTDRILARQAVASNFPLCVSSSSTSTLEQMRNWGGTNVWQQLYTGRTVDSALDILERARTVGYETIILTADVPVLSRRIRDARNGFEVPFRIGPRQVADLLLHPSWSMRTMLAGIPKVANYGSGTGRHKYSRYGSRTGANWEFLAELRQTWQGKLVVKGVMTETDACRLVDAGVDAIYVSNHGGRQLDAAEPAICALPGIRRAVGAGFPLLFDSGVRSGEDVIRALALGADFVFFGRPMLFAVGADGARGLSTLVDSLAHDISVALAQLGVASVAEIGPEILL